MEIINQAVLLLVSFIANAFSAFSGGGAGLLQLPALIFLGLPFATALATHKLATIALGIGATLKHLKASHLERQFSVFILAAGLPGVLVGANIVLQINSRYAEVALGLLTISLGVYSWLHPQLGQDLEPRHRNTHGYLIGGLLLFLVGILNGSLTSGTGLFVTIVLIKWFGLDYKRAVAYTLVLVGLFWNAAGAITVGLQTEIRYSWLPALLIGSVLGGYVGAHMAIHVGNRYIKRGFEIVTILIGVQLILHRV